MTLTYSDHARLDERSLALHGLVAKKLAAKPLLIEIARENLRRWQHANDVVVPAFVEWKAILNGPFDLVVRILTERTENAQRLRQSSPFAGLLTESERKAIYESYSARTYHPGSQRNFG